MLDTMLFHTRAASSKCRKAAHEAMAMKLRATAIGQTQIAPQVDGDPNTAVHIAGRTCVNGSWQVVAWTERSSLHSVMQGAHLVHKLRRSAHQLQTLHGHTATE